MTLIRSIKAVGDRLFGGESGLCKHCGENPTDMYPVQGGLFFGCEECYRELTYDPSDYYPPLEYWESVKEEEGKWEAHG